MENQKKIKMYSKKEDLNIDMFYKLLDLSFCNDLEFKKKELNKIHNLCSTPS